MWLIYSFFEGETHSYEAIYRDLFGLRWPTFKQLWERKRLRLPIILSTD